MMQNTNSVFSSRPTTAKASKPKHHLCETCGRVFARLEHLNRHIRSHTKEKPFECPECLKCFARRDLQLRHQQKLHGKSSVIEWRPARRNQTRSDSFSRDRRRAWRENNLLYAFEAVSEEPSEPLIDFATLISSSCNNEQDLNGMPGPSVRRLREAMTDISNSAKSSQSHWAKYTESVALVRTPKAKISEYKGSSSGTVDPTLLGFPESLQPSVYDLFEPLSHQDIDKTYHPDTGSGSLYWPFSIDKQIADRGPDRPVSMAISSTSVRALDHSRGDGRVEENLMHGVSHNLGSDEGLDLSISPLDLSHDPINSSLITGKDNSYRYSASPTLTDSFRYKSLSNTWIPDSGAFRSVSSLDTSKTSDRTNSRPTAEQENNTGNFEHELTRTITEKTRQDLIAMLSISSSFSHYADTEDVSQNMIASNLPSTNDLRRYIVSYIQYFHPRLPFIHLPTVSLDSPSFADGKAACSGHTFGGNGPLILSMALVGAMFAFDHIAARILFNHSKKSIQLYLESRCRDNSSHGAESGNNQTSGTPVWLVQAMLLNMIYGHGSGDETSVDIASSHCATLVSLARAAGLFQPTSSTADQRAHMACCGRCLHGNKTEEIEWYAWKVAEERKRTFFGIFILSSLLVSVYNSPPFITNAEVYQDLPCDDQKWNAKDPAAWRLLQEGNNVKETSMPFTSSLGSLLSTSEQPDFDPRNIQTCYTSSGFVMELESLPKLNLYPSTFGCVVLINALQNYIWETRRRHLGCQWTTEETESMQAHIGSALMAWQAVWKTSIEQSFTDENPFGGGPLSTDCRALFDLAYVRVFVDLNKSKTAFWHADSDWMPGEVESYSNPNSPEVPPSPNGGTAVSPSENATATDEMQSCGDWLGSARPLDNGTRPGVNVAPLSRTISEREVDLRRAAIHAIHSLISLDRHAFSIANFCSREMTMPSALCAMECAQVLAVWVAELQARVGCGLGILGKDIVEFETEICHMFVDQEDITLLAEIDAFVRSADQTLAHLAHIKVDFEPASIRDTLPLYASTQPHELARDGYASRIMMITAQILDSAPAWSSMHVMARLLESQAAHMQKHAENSVLYPDHFATLSAVSDVL